MCKVFICDNVVMPKSDHACYGHGIQVTAQVYYEQTTFSG